MTATDLIRGLLLAERAALLAGQLGSLAAIAEQKDAALGQLGDLRAEELMPIRLMAEANQHLLAAAGSGIRAAQRRLREIEALEGRVTGYGPQGGHKLTFPAPRHDRKS